ncbi:SA1362 family protein [Desertibacillus haloalkaliphilus]|uniref:SA1362 family protein n=1 Tax=Desertibacillus haloalkaliphilus TaxID=1328930 RepID=UPI001C254C2A|nr:SA1362 family protein [Desertibacillus haloalkaliphilus]MBU8907715.1 hypothetical protein [Desertibacillus haloalkaliphilus]
MSRQPFHPLVLLIIGLAVVGLLYRLYTDPVGLFVQALIFVGIAAGLFFLFKRFMAKKYGMQAPQRQQRSQRANPFKKNNVVPHKRKATAKKTPTRPLNKRKNEHNLKVIEGKKNKSKKKNRALF